MNKISKLKIISNEDLDDNNEFNKNTYIIVEEIDKILNDIYNNNHNDNSILNKIPYSFFRIDENLIQINKGHQSDGLKNNTLNNCFKMTENKIFVIYILLSNFYLIYFNSKFVEQNNDIILHSSVTEKHISKLNISSSTSQNSYINFCSHIEFYNILMKNFKKIKSKMYLGNPNANMFIENIVEMIILSDSFYTKDASQLNFYKIRMFKRIDFIKPILMISKHNKSISFLREILTEFSNVDSRYYNGTFSLVNIFNGLEYEIGKMILISLITNIPKCVNTSDKKINYYKKVIKILISGIISLTKKSIEIHNEQRNKSSKIYDILNIYIECLQNLYSKRKYEKEMIITLFYCIFERFYNKFGYSLQLKETSLIKINQNELLNEKNEIELKSNTNDTLNNENKVSISYYFVLSEKDKCKFIDINFSKLIKFLEFIDTYLVMNNIFHDFCVSGIISEHIILINFKIISNIIQINNSHNVNSYLLNLLVRINTYYLNSINDSIENSFLIKLFNFFCDFRKLISFNLINNKFSIKRYNFNSKNTLVIEKQDYSYLGLLEKMSIDIINLKSISNKVDNDENIEKNCSILNVKELINSIYFVLNENNKTKFFNEIIMSMNNILEIFLLRKENTEFYDEFMVGVQLEISNSNIIFSKEDLEDLDKKIIIINDYFNSILPKEFIASIFKLLLSETNELDKVEPINFRYFILKFIKVYLDSLDIKNNKLDYILNSDNVSILLELLKKTIDFSESNLPKLSSEEIKLINTIVDHKMFNTNQDQLIELYRMSVFYKKLDISTYNINNVKMQIDSSTSYLNSCLKNIYCKTNECISKTECLKLKKNRLKEISSIISILKELTDNFDIINNSIIQLQNMITNDIKNNEYGKILNSFNNNLNESDMFSEFNEIKKYFSLINDNIYNIFEILSSFIEMTDSFVNNFTFKLTYNLFDIDFKLDKLKYNIIGIIDYSNVKLSINFKSFFQTRNIILNSLISLLTNMINNEINQISKLDNKFIASKNKDYNTFIETNFNVDPLGITILKLFEILNLLISNYREILSFNEMSTSLIDFLFNKVMINIDNLSNLTFNSGFSILLNLLILNKSVYIAKGKNLIEKFILTLKTPFKECHMEKVKNDNENDVKIEINNKNNTIKKKKITKDSNNLNSNSLKNNNDEKVNKTDLQTNNIYNSKLANKKIVSLLFLLNIITETDLCYIDEYLMLSIDLFETVNLVYCSNNLNYNNLKIKILCNDILTKINSDIKDQNHILKTNLNIDDNEIIGHSTDQKLYIKKKNVQLKDIYTVNQKISVFNESSFNSKSDVFGNFKDKTYVDKSEEEIIENNIKSFLKMK